MAHIQPTSSAFIVLAVSAGLVWSGQGRATTMTAAPSQVPIQFGAWSGKALPVEQNVIDILETPDVALMEYHLGQGAPIWFAQVSGFGKRAAFHPPELCYVGSHFEVLDREPITLSVNGRRAQVMRLVLSQAGQQFEAWYWFTANGRVTANYYQQQLWLLMDSIHGKPMAGTMIRVSTLLDKDPAKTHQRLQAFLNEFDAAVARNAHGTN